MSSHPNHSSGLGGLTRDVSATATSPSECAHALRQWLAHAVLVDAQRSADTHDGLAETVHICIDDRGTWVEPNRFPEARTSGRGLRLMRALADGFDIQGTEQGTTVCLQFTHCPAETRHLLGGTETQARGS
ncbi:hypothetical protein BH11ACT6_BH11ACT6_17120 [soil metagenome]